MPLPTGKLPPHLLEAFLSQNSISDPRVLVGPRLGEDAAVIDIGQTLLVVKTDPITFATDLIGWYTVNVNANDIATMGATPRWFLATVLLPRDCPENLAQDIGNQLVEACRTLDIALVGGHTEITHELDRPIVVGCLLGEVARDQLVTSQGARPGDVIILANAIAIEGTAILAREASSELRKAGLSASEVEAAARLLFDPGISVLSAARAGCGVARPHAMHDPTEGGLATGLWELAQASRVGMRIRADSIPVLPLCDTICRRLHLNPLGLIASGALLIAAAPEDAKAIIEAVEKAGFPAAQIGEFTPNPEELILITPNGPQSLPRFDRDELARFLES